MVVEYGYQMKKEHFESPGAHQQVRIPNPGSRGSKSHVNFLAMTAPFGCV